LAKAPVDVIVSDMRMPGMDGWELLAEVRKLYPQTMRLVLSGHADARSIMRASAWRTSTWRSRARLGACRRRSLVGRVDTLPSTPKAFQEILACLQRPTASVAEAGKIIARDIAMTAAAQP
jgi:CheY-like chemotaxis protein